MEVEHISISEDIQKKSEDNLREYAKMQRKLDEKEKRIGELEREITEIKSKRVHYDENKIMAEFEMRLIRVEGFINDIHSKLFQPSVMNPKQMVLSSEGKRIRRGLK